MWAVLRRLAGIAALAPDVGRGVALRGKVWVGGEAETFDGVVVVGGDGRVAAVGPAGHVPLPAGLPVADCAWIGPGVTDAHVHLSRAVAASSGNGGALVAVRDLGSPPDRLAAWRTALPLVVVGSGPVLVGGSSVPGGVSGSGSERWAPTVVAGQTLASGVTVVDGPAAARRVVAALVAEGVDLVEVRVGQDESSGPPGVVGEGLRAVVTAAHAAGLPVVAHALTAAAVRAALAAGVDEFAHVPVEPLPEDVVEQVADAGVAVVSTLQRHATAGPGPAHNATELHRAGVRLLYGTDGRTSRTGASGAVGASGSIGAVGVDPRELDRLAYAGLGRLGALLAATSDAAQAAGLAGRAPSGRIKVGTRAALVGLHADPLVEPAAWRVPAVVVRGTALTTG